MRTRFLNTDYFTTTSSSSPIETLSFLNLPVPHLSPSHLPACKDDILRFGSVLDVSLDVEQLPIHSAFSKFFSEVIPQVINVDYRDFEDLRLSIRKGCDNERETDILHEGKEAKSQRAFGSEALEKDDQTAADEKNTHKFGVIQFETPELDVFLENVALSEKEEIWTISEVPEIDSNDMLKPGFPIEYPSKVQESVYSVEDIALDYHVDKNAHSLEDDGSSPDQMLFQCMFPLLEVDEISLGILTSLSVEDELLSVLEKSECQHWTQKDNMITNSKEILGSLESDASDFLLDHISSKQCLEPLLASMDMFHELDSISMMESSQLKENSEYHQMMADGDCILSMSSVIFEELVMPDVDSSKLFEAFFSTQTTIESVTCDWMFREDMNFKNFNELIISHELALIDDAFKSLPIPVFSDYHNMRSVCSAVLEEKLAELKEKPFSASDGIYLDWHLLEGDKCSSKIFCCHQKMFNEVDSCNLVFDLVSSDDEKLVFDFIFSDGASSGPNLEGCEEPLNVDFNGISTLAGHLKGVSSDKLRDNESPKPINTEQSGEKKAERASLLFKSMSEFNDLDFFLNPQKVVTRKNGESGVNESDTIASSSNLMATGFSSVIQLQQWDIVLYKVMLSDDIVALIDIFRKSYLDIARNETDLNSFIASDDFKLLSLPTQQLMDCINKKMLQKATSHRDENSMAFVTLCAIKQMAWYTCFYGIHTAHLYVEKLCKSEDCFKSRLGSLQSLIADADGKVDKEITRSHPSLLVIQGILQSNTSQSSLKVLILAEQAFWWSLKRLVMSMGLSCNELQNFCTHVGQPDITNFSQFANAKMDDLPVSDCLLVSHEFVSASFPFNKFNLILEYGGSYGSSRISSLSPKFVGLPRIHFLKVELDDSSASRALCDGVHMSRNAEVDGEFHSILNDVNMRALKLYERLNFVPVGDRDYLKSGEAADNVEACGLPPSVLCPELPMESEQVQQRMPSSPDTVIIVNTQNFDKKMIVSRRRTYQRILAMEKQGVQVVERDSDLPVDIIISSAICLVWYDFGNIGKKAIALDETSSSLPLYVENIATNVLTLLSFTFSSCILVFEGETNFICTVMESSDELYAAAASLGLDLQLFCSYSSELTDEIILSCIGHSIKSTRVLYPKMPESETLAESFLTKFPSVNPLTAHAMLSSIGMLIEFLECSHKHRILAIQKYYVPDESINLFSTLCKYGEREDSKSIMTDCSSSVSSGADSDKCHLNVGLERKRQKCIYDAYKIDIPTDDFLHFEPLNQFTNSILNPVRVSKPYDSWKDPEMFDEYEKSSSSLNDLFGKKQEVDFDVMMKPSRVSEAHGTWILECPQILKEMNKPNFSLKDRLLTQNQRSDIATMADLNWHNISESSNLQEDFIGEVMDLTSCPLSGNENFSAPKSLSLSPSVPEIKNDSMRKSKIARKLSFHRNSHPPFPTAAEINFGSDILSSGKVSVFQQSKDHPVTECNNDKLLLEHRKNLLDKVLGRTGVGSEGEPFKEEISHYGGTPLSNAIRSGNPQPGSPWTMEFLNRIREKSRLRQQSLPCDTAAPCFGISGNISKATKRRSPSILEFFKYQGGSNPGKFPEQKKQKRSIQSSSSSKNKIPSTSFLPTWTPIDKKARQTLSFAVNGSGTQTKLVWSDGNAQGMRKKFQNQ